MKDDVIGREEQLFLNALKSCRKNGIRITMDGDERSLSEIADICMVREKGTYGGSCRCNEEGMIEEIQFSRNQK